MQLVEVHLKSTCTKALAVSIRSVTLRATVDGVEYDMVSCVRVVSRFECIEGEGKVLTLEVIYGLDCCE